MSFQQDEKSAPVEIFSASQLADLLEHASSEFRPCIALAAFAGLRSEEVLRLEWSDVDRRSGFVEIAADKAKTATRRLVPITNNLAAWLAGASRNGPKIWPKSKAWFFESLRGAVTSINENRRPKAVVFEWKQNALRHSFISYRLADTQDINRVALEAGNSPQMIYHELATPAQARNWFSLARAPATNVVPIKHSAAI